MQKRNRAAGEAAAFMCRACTSAASYKGYGWGLALLMLVYLLMASALREALFAPSHYNSYALQAMVWRSGHIVLPQNYEWLELAIYQGNYYVSFPPFPTVPMWLLTFFFGQDVPSMFCNMLMWLGSYTVGYAIARRLLATDSAATAFAVCWVAGCNLLEVSLYGGVWNLAQGMSFLLTMLAIYGALRGRGAWGYAAPVCLACAVGCRPFQAYYVPVVLCALWQGLRREGDSTASLLRRMLPRLITPALIACAYGIYNYVRFDSALEFGHNYLPEYLRSEHGQFSSAYVLQNIRNILRLPHVEDAQLRFPTAFGFAFYLANPLYLLAALRLIESAIRKELDGLDALIWVCAALHFSSFLFHKGFGAWQFGTRYLIDVLPVLGWFVLRKGRSIRFHEGLILLWAIGFNIYGGILFHLG